MSPVLRSPQAFATTAPPKEAAVLLMLYERAEELHFVLMRRTEYPGVHSGQISFPGGKREQGESAAQAALRETYEELGIALDTVEVLGNLTELYIPPSNYLVQPIVGRYAAQPCWQPKEDEVAEVIEVPLRLLFDDSLKGAEETVRYGYPFRIVYYNLFGHKVWGATASILSELEMRLRTVLHNF
ncbi:MAG: CoA pyrophosphatase [Chloroflexi bacterium CFX4]|nr:CoA pyrophosphatase [Chloroflexi bacterium CFX4]MDL1921376.1 CoA pyrophosphatase [Chloroflexi bacterium CFX3]